MNIYLKPKIFRALKLSTLCLILGVEAGFATESYSQKTTFTISVQDQSVKEVFDYIEQHSEFIIFYLDETIDVNRKVSVNLKDQRVESILEQLFKNTDVMYTINDRQILLSKRKEVTEVAPVVAVVQQKKNTVTGVVLDPTGMPVIGANIMVKGTTSGTITDMDGKFSLDVDKDATLVVSYIGFASQEIKVGNQTKLSISLKEDSEALDELVVVGFGTQKKASVVGSVQTVKPKELKVPSSSLSNSFAGRIAGVVAVQRSGEPGADGANFWIRGVSTFAGPTSPLIFIDGVEASTGDLNALSPEVIENFSVLKDATATALYGARGANGVMLVTTRNGRENERATINVRVQNSFTSPTETIELADGVDYMNVYNYALLNRTPEATPRFSQEKIEGTMKGLNPYVYPNVDWQNYLFKNMSTTQSANLNVSGGMKKVTYFLSASLNNDNGMFKNDPLNKFDNNINQFRVSFQGNIGAQLTETTKVSLRINSQILSYSGTAAGTGAIYSSIFYAPPVLFTPTIPAQNGEDHILFGNMDGGPTPVEGANIYQNPYAKMVSGYSDRDESTVTTSFEIDQDLKFITPGLRIKGLISYKNWSTTTVTRSFTPYYYTVDSYTQNANGGFDYTYRSLTKGTTALGTSTGNGGDRYLNIQASLDYARTFNDVHDVGAMIVYLQRDYNTNAPGDYYSALSTRNQGFAGRLTYGYDNRYLMEANFGYNGSENFQDGHRFGFFPSVALGYNISNEKYFKPLTSVISNLKVRGSIGLVGNSFTDPRFPYLTFVNLTGKGYTFGNNWQTSMNGALITKYGADGAKWEKGIKTDVGFDLNLFNSLNITADYFQEKRSDIFMQRRMIPAETGVTGDLNPYANLGKVKNRGVDFSIDYNKSINKDLTVGVKANFTYATNQLLERDEPIYPENEKYRSEIGKPLNCYTGLVAIGYFKDEEDIANSPEQTFSSYTVGDIKYADLNGDNKIDGSDQQIIGKPTVPEIVYGFGGSVQYKNWDFSVFFQGVANTSLMMSDIHPFNSDQSSLFKFIAEDHWTPENPDAAYPRLITNINSHNNFQSSTFWLRNGAFLRLKSAEIGYTYKWMRLFISGENLLTFSPFDHWDPELGGGNGLKYPNLRVGTIGLQMNF